MGAHILNDPNHELREKEERYCDVCNSDGQLCSNIWDRRTKYLQIEDTEEEEEAAAEEEGEEEKEEEKQKKKKKKKRILKSQTGTQIWRRHRTIVSESLPKWAGQDSHQRC